MYQPRMVYEWCHLKKSVVCIVIYLGVAVTADGRRAETTLVPPAGATMGNIIIVPVEISLCLFVVGMITSPNHML